MHTIVKTKTVKEYRKMAYEIVRNPNRVYVKRNAAGTYYMFFKVDLMVTTSDDNLSILSFYRIEDEWIKRRVQTLSSAILRIL
ncbi:hypothetical protein Hydth_1139 [Hydrogenobacter thermophilus TK-6]|uniref:Uncharacterized protein n=1 Tax=Hydrogenobacter thermophilus (strain DSM 6534 / IAM 12695 / TK-6) TaxID=608538 RepID=D3DIE9_HYDTT|nr:hypothetical protein [Hydrogenobacter thermophilus]ADO45527.1 hypothetical protein Hydth_1139 [Hydrogenobacter thermophilus TK-6]BAI69601.1 hypothetical protein HTH_1147 [Hydrogenobacter thermophilus TK-6]